MARRSWTSEGLKDDTGISRDRTSGDPHLTDLLDCNGIRQKTMTNEYGSW